MKKQQDRIIARLVTRGRKWWNISFYDKRIDDFVLIDLKTDNYDVAHGLYKWWLFERLEQATISAPRPVMGMSVHRAISDFMSAPDIPSIRYSKESMAIYEKLMKGFGHISIQKITQEDCRIYAESRRPELVYEDISEPSLREVHQQIRKELKLLRSIARYARRWQRITANDMPDIQLNVIATRMSYRAMMGPIRTTGRRIPVKLGAWAYVQKMMFLYSIRNHNGPKRS